MKQTREKYRQWVKRMATGEIPPIETTADYKAGEEAQANEDYPAMRESAQRLQRDYYFAAQPHLMEGIALLHLDEPRAALEAFKQARNCDYSGIMPLMGLAAAYGQLGILDKAIELLVELIMLQPTDLAAWASLKCFYECAGLDEYIPGVERAMQSLSDGRLDLRIPKHALFKPELVARRLPLGPSNSAAHEGWGDRFEGPMEVHLPDQPQFGEQLPSKRRGRRAVAGPDRKRAVQEFKRNARMRRDIQHWMTRDSEPHDQKSCEKTIARYIRKYGIRRSGRSPTH